MAALGLSYSRLNMFEQCEAKFDYIVVSKTVKDTPGEASEYGQRVHKTLQLYGEKKLPEKLSLEEQQTIDKWGHIVDLLTKNAKGEIYFEKQLCVDSDLKPVDWFSKTAYIRMIADLLIINGSTAYCFDYKTGKQKDDPTQLKLFALMIMWTFPQVTTVRTCYIWLGPNKTDTADYTRDYLDDLWAAIKPRFDKVIDTVELGFFSTTPSGLCNYCPAKKICPDSRGR